MAVGYAWIETLMPPVVTGAIVAVIGLNLAPIAVKGIAGNTFDTWIGLVDRSFAVGARRRARPGHRRAGCRSCSAGSPATSCMRC